MRPLRRHHRTTPRLTRILGSLLLVAAVGAMTTGAAPDREDAADHPLDRVIPAPASVDPGGSPYRITRGTHIRVDDSREARRVGDYLADLLRPSTGYRLPVTSHGHGGIQLRLAKARTATRVTAWTAAAAASPSPRARPPVSSTASRPSVSSCPPPSRRTPCSPDPGWSRAAPSRTPRATAGAAPCWTSPGTLLHRRRGQGATSTGSPSTSTTSSTCTSATTRAGASPSTPWPRLATYGGSTEVGGGPGGYYTKADYKEILRYAASRHLEVIPEIDMPGPHQRGPRLLRRAELLTAWRPRCTPASRSASARCAWTRRSRTSSWTTSYARSPRSPRAATSTSVATRRTPPSHEDFVRFMGPGAAGRREVRQDGHRLAPAGRRHPAEGALVQYWGLDRTSDAEKAQVAKAAQNGTGLILSPADRTYLDMKYNKDTRWACPGRVTWRCSGPTTGIRRPICRAPPPPRSAGSRRRCGRRPWRPLTSSTSWPSRGCRASPSWAGPRRRRTTGTPTRCASPSRHRAGEALGIDYYRSPQVPWTTG